MGTQQKQVRQGKLDIDSTNKKKHESVTKKSKKQGDDARFSDLCSDDEDENYGRAENVKSEEFGAMYPSSRDSRTGRQSNVSVTSHSTRSNNSELELSDLLVQATALDTASKKKKKKEDNQMKGAAAAAGILGFAAAGPLGAVAAAGGAALLASKNNGKAGEMVRAGGNAVQKAGYQMKQFDKKHLNVVGKGMAWASNMTRNQQQQEESDKGEKGQEKHQQQR